MFESMTPAERVAFILNDAFGYRFTEVAEITGRRLAACRQAAASTARRRVRASRAARPGQPGRPASSGTAKASGARDIGALIGILDPEATVTADGGRLATAALRSIEGDEQIARFYAGIVGIAPNVAILERMVNRQPGVAAQPDGVVTVFAFDIEGKHIWTAVAGPAPGAGAAGQAKTGSAGSPPARPRPAPALRAAPAVPAAPARRAARGQDGQADQRRSGPAHPLAAAPARASSFPPDRRV